MDTGFFGLCPLTVSSTTFLVAAAKGILRSKDCLAPKLDTRERTGDFLARFALDLCTTKRHGRAARFQPSTVSAALLWIQEACSKCILLADQHCGLMSA